MTNAYLSPAQLRLHEKAVNVCAQHLCLEAEIIEILIAIEAQKVHRLLGYSSLFTYAVEGLGLSESNAYAFPLDKQAKIIRISIARVSTFSRAQRFTFHGKLSACAHLYFIS